MLYFVVPVNNGLLDIDYSDLSRRHSNNGNLSVM